VIIEAYSPHGWERYADAGYSMHTFGQSLTGDAVYARFGFEGGRIAGRVRGWLEEVEMEGGIGGLRGRWRDLNCYERGVQFKAYHKDK
jgi:dihydroxyacetone synthase